MFRHIGRSCLKSVQRCISWADSDSSKMYEVLLKKSYLLPEDGHDVLIVQPRHGCSYQVYLRAVNRNFLIQVPYLMPISGTCGKRNHDHFMRLSSTILSTSCLFSCYQSLGYHQDNHSLKSAENISKNSTTCKYGPDVEEAVALVDSLEFWTTVDVVFCNVKGPYNNTRTFFSKGVWENVSKTVIEYRDGEKSIEKPNELPTQEKIASSNEAVKKRATAVLINWSRLTTSQLAFMQHAWLMPVYDRYTLVVQLFNLRSRTQEAKVQAKLAEIGLLRARIPAFFEIPDMIKILVDRSDFACKERLVQILNERETHLLNQLDKISRQRSIHKRNHRRDMDKHHLPLVAVVGYTNAGKTSLIRYLSKSDKLTSCPKVFATLDVTHHRTRLPILPTASDDNTGDADQCTSSVGLPGMHMLLLDTIGFMSDLPTNLLAAFRATLNECLEADLILHVVDVSQPGWNLQTDHVEKLLGDIGVFVEGPQNSKNMTDDGVSGRPPEVLKVGNKIDRIESDFMYTGFDALVSTKSGAGMMELTSKIQLSLMRRLGWFSRTLDISQGSSSLQWIYSNAMVTNVHASRPTQKD
ncbi:unnamed protein product [Heterobilharzia americana]|nr:unnamed protein product [Heterobilharzia americana]